MRQNKQGLLVVDYNPTKILGPKQGEWHSFNLAKTTAKVMQPPLPPPTLGNSFLSPPPRKLPNHLPPKKRFAQQKMRPKSSPAVNGWRKQGRKEYDDPGAAADRGVITPAAACTPRSERNVCKTATGRHARRNLIQQRSHRPAQGHATALSSKNETVASNSSRAVRTFGPIRSRGDTRPCSSQQSILLERHSSSALTSLL